MGSNSSLVVVLSGLVLGLLERTKALTLEHGLTLFHDREKRPVVIVHPSGTDGKMETNFFGNLVTLRERGFDPLEVSLVLDFHAHTLPADREDCCFLSPGDLEFGIQHTLFERVVSVARSKKVIRGDLLRLSSATVDQLVPAMLMGVEMEIPFSIGQDCPLFLVGDLRHDFFQFSFPASSSELGKLRESAKEFIGNVKQNLQQQPGIELLQITMSLDDMARALFYIERHNLPDMILPPQRQFFRSAGQSQAEVEAMLEKLLEPFGLQGEPVIIRKDGG